MDIIARYETLTKENKKQQNIQDTLEDKLKFIKESTTKYVKDKSTEIMKLNNNIIDKNEELEFIVEEQNRLKSQA